jgi:hypothetical protein
MRFWSALTERRSARLLPPMCDTDEMREMAE